MRPLDLSDSQLRAKPAGSVGPPAMTTEERRALAEAARRWHDAGCCVHPAKADGSKKPVNVQGGSPDVDDAGDHGWGWGRIAHGDIPSLAVDDIAARIMAGKVDGVGVFTGAASGHLEMIEVEGRAVERLNDIRDAASRMGAADLLERLSHGCVERSAGGGLHFLLRVSDGPALGNTKLAGQPDPETPGNELVLAETRGVGGWFVAAPSAGRTHKSGRPYEFVWGGPETIPTFTAAERDQLHDVFRSIDEMPAVEPIQWKTKQIGAVERTAGRGVSPGDDFAQRTSWEEILRPAGWKLIGQKGRNLEWTRPGKESGPSATTMTGPDGDLMYVFTTSTPLPAEKGLGKFAVYTHLHHSGDYPAAAKDLREKGYGDNGDEWGVEVAVAAASGAPDDADDADLSGLSFVPAGRPDGMLARVSVSRDGKLVDLAEIDLGNLEKRENYAGRVAGILGGGAKVDIVKEWLLQAAFKRATPAAVVLAEEVKAKVSERVITFADCVAQWSQHEKRPAITTMFRPYDDATGGIPCGQLTVFMSQPSAGKTAMMLQLVAGATLYDPKLVTLWGLGEMTPALIAERMACVGASLIDGASVTMDDAKDRTTKARKSLADLEQKIAGRFLILTDLTIDYIEAAVKQTGAGLVVIDYLQLVSGGPGHDRVSDTDAIMGRIKKLATTLNVAVVMASSLPRSVDGESKIGSLGRGSAEIDFGADYVYFARPDEHKNEKGERAVLWKNKKARNGDTIDLETIFDGASQTFYSAARAEEFPEFASERVAR